MQALLQQTAHRPWPLPEERWSLYMRWSNLAFLHWPISEAVLRPLIPSELTIDTFDGTAWLGVVPFRMENTKHRLLPTIPTATTFPELNVRTYVRRGDRSGVWFFSLDAASRLAVWGARTMFNLPYHTAAMQIQPEGSDIHYTSARKGENSLGQFNGRYAPAGPAFIPEPDTFEYWLTERYCLFGQQRTGAVYYIDIHHPPWTLQSGVAEIRHNTMTEPSEITLPPEEPLVHIAHPQDVLAWMPTYIK